MPITIIHDVLADNNDFPTDQLCSFKIPASILVCALTNERLVDPVVASDGYTYSKYAIEAWFEQQANKEFVQSPIKNCENILEIDPEQKLILRSNRLIAALLEKNENDTLDINESGLIDHMSACLIRIPLIYADGQTYDLHSEAKWMEVNNNLTTSLTRTAYHFATFPNHLVAKILKSFHHEYQGLHNIADIKARQFFYEVKMGKTLEAKNFLADNPKLITQKLNEQGAKLIHILAALDEKEMLDFLVTNLRVRLDTKDNNNAVALFHACKSPTFKVLEYWKTKLPLDFKIEPTKQDVLIFALALENINFIKQLFKFGFQIDTINAKYIPILGNLLAFKSFEFIDVIIQQLGKQKALYKVAPLIFDLAILAQNKMILAENFEKIFGILNSSINKPDFAKYNPYILGAMSKNIAFLQGFNSFAAKAKYQLLINQRNISGHGADGVTCLQMATVSKLPRLINLVMSYGANPKYQDHKYSFDVALITLAGSKTSFDYITSQTILDYLLTANLVNLQPMQIYRLFSKCPVGMIFELLTNDNYAMLLKIERTVPFIESVSEEVKINLNIERNNNTKLSYAYRMLIKEQPQLMQIFKVRANEKHRNILHACVNIDNKDFINFIKFLIITYPDLLNQSDLASRTPFDYALSQSSSVEVIKEMLKVIHMLKPAGKFRDIEPQNLITNKFLSHNPKLNQENKEELKSYIKQLFQLEPVQLMSNFAQLKM